MRVWEIINDFKLRIFIVSSLSAHHEIKIKKELLDMAKSADNILIFYSYSDFKF
jgi:hypothetical protein